MTKKQPKQTEAERIHRAYTAAVSVAPSPLTDRERDIIEQYYGFDGNFKHTLEEIAALQNPPVTRERIRQIKHHALRKIGATDN